MALSLIIFDCDGIILESVEVKNMAMKRVGDDFGPALSDRLVMYHKMHGGVSRFKKFAWLYEEHLGRSITPEEERELNEKFVRYAFEAIVDCPLVPGIQEVLDCWKGRLPLYVASGAPQEELDFLLQKRGIAGYFDGIYGSPPGKADLLCMILQRTSIASSDAVMIGDSSTDLHAAEATGTLFYGRGEYFRSSGYPWHADLTKLNDYLESLLCD